MTAMNMPRTLKFLAAFSLIASVAAGFAYRYYDAGILLTASITCGTIAYHLCVRLLTGAAISRLALRVDPGWSWFRPRSWEAGMYERLGVKRWKARLPTYVPGSFSYRLHDWKEITRAMCVSELVHEANCLTSFVPVLAAIWVGALPVFMTTSILSAAFDMLFVIIQRYNRPRVLALAGRQEKRRKPPRRERKYEPE